MVKSSRWTSRPQVSRVRVGEFMVLWLSDFLMRMTTPLWQDGQFCKLSSLGDGFFTREGRGPWACLFFQLRLDVGVGESLQNPVENNLQVSILTNLVGSVLDIGGVQFGGEQPKVTHEGEIEAD